VQDQAAFQAALTSAGTTQGNFNSVMTAYNALQANPNDPTLQANYSQALTTAGLTDASFQTLLNAYNTAQTDAQKAQSLLNAASNKAPVSAQTKAALDAMLATKNITAN